MNRLREEYQYVAYSIPSEDSHNFGDYVIIFTFRRKGLRCKRAYLYNTITGQIRSRRDLRVLNPHSRTAQDCKKAVERLENDR